MKKSYLAVSLAVIFCFMAAVGLCVRALFGAEAVSAFDEGGMRIVVDAGHGGIDGGVVGCETGIKESDLNLSLAYRLQDVLTDMGFEVTMTRKTEAGLYDAATKGFKKRDMQKRREIITAADPSLVISVHQNFYPSKKSRGAQVFYNDKVEGGALFAGAVQTQLNDLYAEKGVKGRKITAGEFYVLECVDRPSIIVECGFLSNPLDEELLRSEQWQEKLAQSIGAGVVAYLAGNAT